MAQKIKIVSVEVGKANSIFPDSYSEDSFLVTATTAGGEVYMHLMTFTEAQANKLHYRVALARMIDLDHWSFFRTVYGSTAFAEEELDAFAMATAIRNGSAHEKDFEGMPAAQLL